MRSDISAVTLFYLSCQLYIRSAPITSFICLSLHSSLFTCDLYPHRSPLQFLIFFIFQVSVTYCSFFYSLFCCVYLSSSFCSVCPPALLLFVFVINSCLQAEDEALVCFVAGVCLSVCVSFAYYAHLAVMEDIPEGSCPILKHKDSLTLSPLTHLCHGRASALQL